MSSRYFFLATIGLALVVLFRLITLENPVDSNNFALQGQITSSPYLSYDNLVFFIGRYKITSAYQNLEYGDKVKIVGKKVGYEIQARSVEELPQGYLENLTLNLRKNLEKRINDHFPQPQSDLLSGILLGIKTNLSREFKANLVNTGTIHVVVVSGYNIVLIGSFVLFLAPYLGRKKTTALALAVIFFYSVLVGFSAPTLRALIMGALSLSAVLLGRRSLAFYALCFSALTMLLINPEFVWDISFQLTFAATLGVLLFTKRLEAKLTKLPKWFSETLATTLAAQVFVVPLIFYYFGSVSLMSPLVNTLVLWIVPISTMLGFIFLGLTFVSVILANLISYLLVLPLTFFTTMVSFFGRLNFLVLSFEKGNLVSTIGYYLVVLAFLPRYLKTKLNKSR